MTKQPQESENQQPQLQFNQSRLSKSRLHSIGQVSKNIDFLVRGPWQQNDLGTRELGFQHKFNALFKAS